MKIKCSVNSIYNQTSKRILFTFFLSMLVINSFAQLQWTNVIFLTITGSTLKKPSNLRTEWNAGAISQQSFYNDGWVEFKFLTYKYVIMGLAAHNTSVSPATINYGIYAHINGYLYIFENGIQLSAVGKGKPIHPQYSPTDVLRVERSNGVVYYKKNDVTFYTSAVPSSGPLHADCAFFLSLATVNVSNYMFGLVWTGAESQDWNEPNNWSLNRVPTSNDQVIINACTNCPKLNESVNIGTLQLNNGSEIDLANHILSAANVIINDSSIKSNQGKIHSADFLEMKNSFFSGSITLTKTGGGGNECYGGNKFSTEGKFINLSNNGWEIASQANNVIVTLDED